MLVAKVYILRHGETNENRAHIIQGQLDTLLNEAGRKQAEMAVDLFRDVDLDFALTSDLQRAVEVSLLVSYSEGSEAKTMFRLLRLS